MGLVVGQNSNFICLFDIHKSEHNNVKDKKKNLNQ